MLDDLVLRRVLYRPVQLVDGVLRVGFRRHEAGRLARRVLDVVALVQYHHRVLQRNLHLHAMENTNM